MDMQTQIKDLQAVVSKQRKLLEFSLHKRTGADSFVALSRLIETPLAVINFHGKLVFHNTHLSEWQLMEHWPWASRARWIRIAGTSFRRSTLTRGGERAGTVLYLTKPTLSKADETLLVQTSEIISGILSTPSGLAYANIEPSNVEDLFARYLAHTICLDTLKEQLTALRVEIPQDGYFCVLAGTRSERQSHIDQATIESILQKLSAFLSLKPGIILYCAPQKGQLFLVPTPRRQSLNTICCAVKDAFQEVLDNDGNFGVRIAISRRKAELLELEDAYLECVDTLRVANGLAFESPIATFSDTEFVSIFDNVPRERMLRYNRLVFKSLHDARNSRDCKLMETLQAYIDHDGQIADVAQALQVHKNTVAYRLEQASELLEIDLKKTTDLLRLKLAFVQRRIIQVTRLAPANLEF